MLHVYGIGHVLKSTCTIAPGRMPQQEENHPERRWHLGKACHHSNQQIGKTKNTSCLNE